MPAALRRPKTKYLFEKCWEIGLYRPLGIFLNFFEVCEAPQACCNLTKSLYRHFTCFYMILRSFRIFLHGFAHTPHILARFCAYFAYYRMVFHRF